MKKIVMLAGLGLMLAGCGVSVSDDLGIYTNSLVLNSNFAVQNATFNGASYSGPVVCDNTTTNMSFDFDYTGNLQKVGLSLVGDKSGDRQALNVTGTNFTASHATVNFDLAAQTAPLSKPGGIHAQAIVVNPTILGSSHIEMVAYSSSGQTDVIQSNSVPVLSNCN